jgi:uncharacterized protein (DUF302 family)
MFHGISRPMLAVAALLGLALVAPAPLGATMLKTDHENGIVAVKSAYSMSETIARIKKDIADKGIMFFSEIEQSKLANNVGIKAQPSTLLVFGNPPLGGHFLTANPTAGLDWPVRILVVQDNAGTVWAVYNDWEFVKRRHGITNRDKEFAMATEVVKSITSTVLAK